MLVQCGVDPGFRTIDYDRREVKKALRKSGGAVRKLARKLISKEAVSKPGQYPGKETGELSRSITVSTTKSGYAALVRPTKTKAMPVYYPAFVVYGHRAPQSETAEEARAHKLRSGKKVAAPRKNFIFDAAEKSLVNFEADMYKALHDAIKPGVL